MKNIKINKYILYSLALIYLFSFAQFMVSEHDVCEEGHSHQKQCPLHKNCCGSSHLSNPNAAAVEYESLLPAMQQSGVNKPGVFSFIENLFTKSIFHPPNFINTSI